MIGTDEMSSTGMDISESFRPEDISKTDFFDFVTAPDMGIGLGVNVNLHHTHHNHHHHNHHTITQQQQQQQQQQQHHHHHHHQQQQQQHHHHHQPQQHHHAQPHHNTEGSAMTHDGVGGSSGGGSVSATSGGGDSHGDTSGLSDGSSASTTDPTLHGYEFWASDKEHTSTIFEDLDRYCWQQQTNTSSTSASANTPINNNTNSSNNSSNQMHLTPSPANSLNPLHSSLVNPTSPHNHHSPVAPVTTTTPTTPVSQTQLNSDGTISNIISTDGQIYTLTVLNGNEPWLKREADTHLQNTLDLDSLLGTFPGYIKSEYPYDDSGFSTDGCKDLNGDSSSIIGSNSQRLPSLINTIASVTSSGSSMVNDGSVTALSIGQQLDQFHNNNNDWHMTDHNNEQNSAESLLRSALQGKGYAKGIHMHNGITLMPTSPTVKDDDMRRILFPVDADGLNFSDTSLSAAQIFDDTQTANGHNPHMIVPHSPVTNGPLTPVTNVANGGPNNNGTGNSNTTQTSSMMVDDMFLTLENAFSDDFEKIKQFCTTASANEYPGNEVMMQISPSGTVGAQAASQQITTLAAVTASQQQQLQTLHAATTSSTTPNSASVSAMTANQVQQQQQQVPPPPPPQPLKPEVTTSSQRILSTAKVTKKYKRTLTTHSSSVSASNNNNNSTTSNNSNPNVINHNNSSTISGNSNNPNSKGSGNLSLTNGSRNGSASSGSSTTSSNSPTHCNGSGVGGGPGGNGGNTSSTTTSSSSTPGQRKERSLHYCSICSKGFKDKYSVNVHIRTHTGEKPFACTLCGKSFRQKAHLAKHYQTHMAQKNNGNMVKGNSNKHHRSSAAAAAVAANQQQQQQQLSLNSSPVGHNHPRPLSISTGGITTPTLTPHSVGLVNGILTTSAGLALGVSGPSGPTTPTTPTTILPPANGLLANR